MTGFFEDSITLVNHYYDKLTREDKFQASILDKCMWRQSTVRTANGNILNIATSTNITILYRDGYVEPYAYAKLSNDEKKKHFTLNTDKTDFVFFGEVKEDLSSIKAINEAKKKYKWTTVQSVTDCTNVDMLKHWEVVGQ